MRVRSGVATAGAVLTVTAAFALASCSSPEAASKDPLSAAAVTSTPTPGGQSADTKAPDRSGNPAAEPTETAKDVPSPRASKAATDKDGPPDRPRRDEKRPASAPPRTPPKTQQVVLDKLPGNNTGTCVAVGTRRDVTSGTMAMGNFRTAQQLYASQHGKSKHPVVNLYAIPKHRTMPGVRITMTPVKADGSRKVVKSQEVEPANLWKYYSVHLPIPAPGIWQLEVRSGSDRGCFEVTFDTK